MRLGGLLNDDHIASGKVVNPAPGASVTINVDSGDVFVWTSAEAETLNASGTQVSGRIIFMLIANDATLGRLITFGTGFKSIGTLLGVVSKKSAAAFISDGTNFYELARTIGL